MTLCVALAVTVLAACGARNPQDVRGSHADPTSIADTIQIVPHSAETESAPSAPPVITSTAADAQTSAAAQSVDPSQSSSAPQSSDVAQGLVDDDLDEDYQATLDSWCPLAHQWWVSSASISKNEWIDAGSGLYASSFALGAYTDRMYAALQGAGWGSSVVEAVAMPDLSAGACLLSKQTAAGETEVVTLMFSMDSARSVPLPGAMLYTVGTVTEAITAAREAAVRN